MDETQSKMYLLVAIIIGVFDVLISVASFIVGQWKIGLFYLIVGAMSIYAVIWAIKEFTTIEYEDVEDDDDGEQSKG